MDDAYFIERAIQLAANNVKEKKAGPFAAVIVKEGNIIAEAANAVTHLHDPTAHAEIQAIRLACKHLNHFSLEGSVLYSSCEPCPMCLGAIYWARISRVVFAATQFQAANAGFDDAWMYEEMKKPWSLRNLTSLHIMSSEGDYPFQIWQQENDKILY